MNINLQKYILFISLSVITSTGFAGAPNNMSTGSTFVNRFTQDAQSQTITYGAMSSHTWTPFSTVQREFCPPGSIAVGHGTGGGGYGSYQMSKDVYYDIWFTGRHNNYTQTLMTSGGTRTIYCRQPTLGYPP